MEWVLWICIGGTLYVYLGYPVLLFVLSRVFGRVTCADDGHTPKLTLVISAYNEERVIAEKISNSLALDYPRHRLEVVVVSDHSNDETDQVVLGFSQDGVRLLRMPARAGKSLGLNAAMQDASGEIVVFTDANAMFDRDALRRLARHFADPQVGCVTGAQKYFNPKNPAGRDEGMYWRYELIVKEMESRVTSLVGSDGAIMAIRRERYQELDAADLSDFIIPLHIVASGYRNVFEPTAMCFEHAADSYEKEFSRKVRIVNRAWRATMKMRHLLNPVKFGWFSLQLFSHKVLRWLVAPLMIGALVSNFAVMHLGPAYAALLAAQAVFYAAAALGFLLSRANVRANALLSAAHYLCMVNLASIKGILESMRGKTYTVWSTTRERDTA